MMVALFSTLASVRLLASARVSVRAAGPSIHYWQLGLRPASSAWPRMVASTSGDQRPEEPTLKEVEREGEDGDDDKAQLPDEMVF